MKNRKDFVGSLFLILLVVFDCIVVNDWYVFEWEKPSEDKSLINNNI